MKGGILIFSILIFLLNSAFMQDKTKKIQEELIKTIKTEYVNWLVKKNSPSMINSFSSEVKDNTAGFHKDDEKNKYDSHNNLHTNCKFYDFDFKITNSQAVVQFKVNNLIKSAFLEKKDGEWQLILCADITPVL